MKRRCLQCLVVLVVLAVVWSTAGTLLACPTCKEGLAHDDPGMTGVAQGFSYSIMLMMSMPFLIFGGLASYFYFEVRRARKRLGPVESLPAAPSTG